MSTRSWEFITTNEPTVIVKPFLDAKVMKDRESDRSFSNPPCTDECDGFEVFGETDHFRNKFTPSETGPWGWGRQSSQGSAVSDVRA